MKIKAILTPAELPAISRHDLNVSAWVVFDVLRATSSFVTALHNGAKAIIPVGEISEALAIKKQPDVLLGGERQGIKIRAPQTGRMDFDFGNSPREFTRQKVHGRTIVSTTTNGTRALGGGANAKTTLAASFLNLGATAKFLRQKNFENVLLVCAGTGESAALEDILAAGALCEILSDGKMVETLSDSAQAVFYAYTRVKSHLAEAIFNSENARRLLAIPELRDDVAFCSRLDVFDLVAARHPDGMIRALV